MFNTSDRFLLTNKVSLDSDVTLTDAFSLATMLYMRTGFTMPASSMPFVSIWGESGRSTFSFKCDDIPGFTFETAMLAQQFNSNDWNMETIRLDLFFNRGRLEEFDTSCGADSVIYLPDSVAKQILDFNPSDEFETFQDIIDADLQIQTNTSLGERSYKIANIIHVDGSFEEQRERRYADGSNGFALHQLIGNFAFSIDTPLFNQSEIALENAIRTSKLSVYDNCLFLSEHVSTSHYSFSFSYFDGSKTVTNDAIISFLMEPYWTRAEPNFVLILFGALFCALGVGLPLLLWKLVSLPKAYLVMGLFNFSCFAVFEILTGSIKLPYYVLAFINPWTGTCELILLASIAVVYVFSRKRYALENQN